MNDITKKRTDIPNSAMLSSYRVDNTPADPQLDSVMQERFRSRFAPPSPPEEVPEPKKGWFAGLIEKIKVFFRK